MTKMHVLKNGFKNIKNCVQWMGFAIVGFQFVFIQFGIRNIAKGNSTQPYFVWLWCVLGTILISCWVCDTRMWRTWVCPPSSPPPHPPPPFTPSPHSRVSRLLACSSSLNTDITVHTTYTVQPRTLEPQTVFAQPETSVVEPEQPKAGFVVVWSWRRPFDVIQPLIKLLSFGTGTDGISKSPASKLLKQDQLLNTQHLIFLLK